MQPVDCILLDLVMPGHRRPGDLPADQGGAGVRDIPLIMLTALEDREAMIDGLDAGADDYIAKSSDFDVLKARVRAQIRRKQFEDENRRIREQLLRRELEAAEARAARELAETRAALAEDLERKNRGARGVQLLGLARSARAASQPSTASARSLLEDYGESLDARGQDYLRRVRAAAQRMGELIDDMLELSRVERAELRRERVDSRAWLASRPPRFARRIRSARVTVVVQPDVVAEVDPRLRPDRAGEPARQRLEVHVEGLGARRSSSARTRRRRRPTSSCATTAPASTWIAPPSSSRPFSGCTRRPSFPAPASASRPSSAS